MNLFRMGLLISCAVSLSVPAHAVYVANDPINLTDPTGQCANTPDGQVGVCPTNAASGELLDQAKSLSPETAEADALAEAAGINVPFTFDPGQTGSVRNGVLNPVTGRVTPTDVTVGGQSSPVSATNTDTGETIAYALGPLESTVHEVGGHVRDDLLGPRATGNRDPNTPNVEVGPLNAENNLRRAMGVPVQRNNYDAVAPVTVGRNGVRPPKTIDDFRN